MSKSNCEELIGIIWIILSLMLFDRGYVIWGSTTLGLGLFSQLCAIMLALRKAMKRRNERNLHEQKSGDCY